MAWEADGIKLPTAGTYVVLLGDCGDVNTGTYDIYLQRTENAFGAKALAFGKIVMGSITEASQSNTYTFHASAKDRVDFTMTITSGSMSPRIRVYDPTGTVVVDTANRFANGECAGGSVWEANTVKLPATGTYTLLVGDCSDTNTGNYAIYGQRTNNPFGPSPMVWGGTTLSGSITSATQNNTYTFGGTTNNSIDMTMGATSGTLSPRVRLYTPDGTLVADGSTRFDNGACAGGSTIVLNTSTLTQTSL